MTAPGVSAGSVYVDVEPRTTNFWAQFIAQTAPGAAAAGAALGTALGAAMAARIRAAVDSAMDDAGRGAGARGAAAGNRFGGLFASTAQARIRAAIRSLPEYTINIHARATDAERKMRELRDQLTALSNKRIGIEISETDARAEIARLKAELDRLAQSAASPRVRVDSGAASLELKRLEEELDRLDGRRANARVEVNEFGVVGALSRMNALISAGLTIGPAIVPAAAAAAGAIGGIGLAALSAAPAVGVLALAFGGISGAVKALGTADREASKSGATAVRQQKSVASSADQVRSAVASLANTRAQAAEQQRRSLAQIADAEKAVTRAQADAVEVQEDLNDAREEERRAQEDTALALKKNAVDQAKAATEVADLQRQLEGFGGEHTANALAEAQQQQQELAAQGKRLTADKARDEKTGVDGSKRVLEAQAKIVEAQEKVVEAVEREGEARLQAASQARQAAFQISQAQAAVIAAQRGAAAGAVTAASAAESALDKLNDELAGLPKSGQDFARFLYGLKPQLDGLRTAAADGLLPGAQRGITALLPYLSGLKGFVGDVADELGDLAAQAGEALTSPFWRQFFNYIGNDAVPVLHGLATVTGNVIEGFAGILLQFAPFERQLGGGLVSVTDKFVAFSKGLGDNKGFQSFVKYALVEGPLVIGLIGALINGGVRLGEAYAPVGSVVVGVLRGITGALNAIPLSVLTVLAATMTAYKAATLLAWGAQTLLNSGVATGIAKMITFRTVTDLAGNSTTGAQRALSGMAGAIGGPLVLALTAAAATIGYLILRQQKVKQEADALKQSAAQYADVLKGGVTPAALQQADALLRQDKNLRGLVDTTQAAGISSEVLAQGLNGELEARDKVNQSIEDQINTAYIAHAFAEGDERKALKAKIDNLEKLKVAFNDSNAGAAEANRLSANLAAEQKNTTDIFEKASPAVHKLADAYKVLADDTASAADKASALKDAEDALFGAARQADEAAEAQQKAIRGTTKTLEERSQVLKDGLLIDEKGAKTLDIKTEAGAKVRDALKDELKAINETYRARVASNGNIEDATRKHQEEIDALKKNAAQHHVNGKAVEDLIDIYGLVPTSAQTAVTITGLDATKQQLDELLAIQYALRNGITVGEAKDKLHPQVTSPGGRGQSRSGNLAEGGPVVGPGTGTSDDVAAVERTTGARFQLSNGEFVQPTASVDYYGQGFMEALRRRSIPRGTVRGYAAGGLVNQILSETYPFPTTTKLTKIPTRAEVAAAVVGKGISGQWPSSPSAQRGDSGVWKSIVALIKSTGPLSGQFGNSYRPGDPLWHGCVPMDTVVLTRRGWVPFEDVRVGVDETVGHNAATGRSEWTRIVGMHHYQDAELWTIGDGNWEAEVTPGHKWLTYHGLVETRNLTTNTLVRLSTPLADDVDGPGLLDEDRGVVGVERTGSRTAEVFCPTTTLGTWTAKQGSRVFLTGNSGRAVDWMGFQQDALATFLSRQNPLELIHRTKQRDYAFTRGRDKGSFNGALMEAHRNHIHIAMRDGGLVGQRVPFGVYDTGGSLPTGLSLAYNGTGRPEVIPHPDNGHDGLLPNLVAHVYIGDREITDIVDVRVERATGQIARDIRNGTRP